MQKTVYKEIYKNLKILEKKRKAKKPYSDPLKEIKKLTKVLVILEAPTTPFEVFVLRDINKENTDLSFVFLDGKFKKIKNYFFVLSYLGFIISNKLLLKIFFNLIPQLKRFDEFLSEVVKNDMDNCDELIANLE